MILSSVLLNIFNERKDKLIQRFYQSPIKRPWMQHKEITIIRTILKHINPEKCFEWGTGFSTWYFPKYIQKKALWISVEHNQTWYESIHKMINRDNTKTNYIPANNYPWTDSNNDGTYSDLADYVDFIKTLNTKFDFILVDGYARVDCLNNALDALEEGGVVFLHNAQREYYREGFQKYHFQTLLTDNSGQSAIWIGSNKRLDEVIPIDDITKMWEMHNRLSDFKKRVKEFRFLA